VKPPRGIDRLTKYDARKECFQSHAAFSARSATLLDMMKAVLCGCSHKYNVSQIVPITHKILQQIKFAEDFDINDFIPDSGQLPEANNSWVEVHKCYKHYFAALCLTDPELIATVRRCIDMISEGFIIPPENRTSATTALSIMCNATSTDAAEAASETATFLGHVEEYILLGTNDYFYNESLESPPPAALGGAIRNLLNNWRWPEGLWHHGKKLYEAFGFKDESSIKHLKGMLNKAEDWRQDSIAKDVKGLNKLLAKTKSRNYLNSMNPDAEKFCDAFAKGAGKVQEYQEAPQCHVHAIEQA